MKTKKRKTIASKILALCLAVMMLMGMSVTAFAKITPDSTANITVTGLEPGVEVTAYQIITVNVNDAAGQPQDPVYYWNAEVAEWILEQSSYTGYIGGNNAVTETFMNLKDTAEAKSFYHDLASAIKANQNNAFAGLVASSKTGMALNEGVATIADAGMGQWLLTAKGGSKIYLPSTVTLIPTPVEGSTDWELENDEVGMKGAKPTIEKDAETETGDQTVAIGDTVTYTLTVLVPEYPEDAVNPVFKVGDKLGEGLDLVGAGGTPAITVKYENTVINNTLYSVSTTPAASDDYTFQITFTKEFLAAYAGETITITYQATVNENAFTEDALGNTAFLGYNHDPYDEKSYETTPVEEEVYTFGIQLDKIDKTSSDKLTGAEFELKKQGEDTALTFNETATGSGIYNYAPTGTDTILKVNNNGFLQIQGLDEGTYILTETKAPNGYVLPNGSIRIILTKDADSGELGDGTSVTSEGTIVINAGENSIVNNVLQFDVVNEKTDTDFDLPATGGMGTMIFTVAGILLMGGAVALVVVAMKKKKSN